MSFARQSHRKAPLGGGAKRHSRARVRLMTAQELMTLAQRHIRSLTAIIDRLDEIGAQDELRRISPYLTRLASLVDDARRILL
jgi:archaellum biogenesis ATPase FlaH